MDSAPRTRVDWKQNRSFVLGSLAFGHGITHLLGQSFPLLLTEMATSMGLGTFQKASLFAMRQVGSTAVNLGGGPIVDMAKAQWGGMLTGCMVWLSLSFLVLGASPGYGVALFAVALVSLPGSLWHLPAGASISQRYPERRGFAISIHGLGSNFGNLLSPILAGGLLAVLLWKYVFYVYAAPSIVVAVFVWWALKDMGAYGPKADKTALATQFREAIELLKHPVVLKLIGAAALLTMGLDTLFDWTPFYLKEKLGMGNLEAGIYYSLLIGMGIISTPVLGALSDKIGRKIVLLTGVTTITLLSLIVVSVGDSLALIPVLVGLGLFSFSIHQQIQVAVLDLAGRGTEGKAIGLLFGLNGIVGISAPFLASLIIDHAGGYGSIYYYAGILTAVTAALLIATPLRAQAPVQPSNA